jgi:DNA-binding CsgD family transcriptional regulator
LVGRDAELESVAAALASGSGGGLVLVGEAGVGKTRLAREAVRRWADAGGDHEWVVGTRAAASIPFGAVSHLLPPVPQSGGTGALVAAVAARFEARTGTGRPVVGVDDAHLLDEASAALLHQLVVRGAAVLVATVRGGEPTCDAVMALWKDTGERLHVRPLPDEAIDRIVAEVLGPVDPISRRLLRRLAGGNPLLLRELLADALETGALVRCEGLWCWRGTVPGDARVGELVAARLRALDPDARAALEIVACGEPLSLSLVERLAGAEAIEAAERSGTAVVERSGARTALRLAHPLYGEVLRAGLPVGRARAIWRGLAEALTAGPMRRRDDVLLAGVWELQSGTVWRPDVLLAAARQAVGRFDLELADRLTRGARSAGGGPAADWLLAEILQFRGRWREAAQVLPAASEADSGQAVTRALILYWGLGQVENAEKALDVTGSAESEATRSWIVLFDGRCHEALAVAETVLGDPAASDQAVIWAAMGGGLAAGLLGRAERAAAIAARGRGVADANADRYPWGQAQVGYGLCLARYATGRLRGAAEVAEHGYRLAVAKDARPMAGFWAAFRGVVAKARGRVADARAALREAIVLMEDGDTYQISRVHLGELAGAHALAGDPAGARDCMARVDAAQASANRLFDAWVELNRAWVEAAGGGLSAAAEMALRAADLARGTEQPTIEAMCRYDAARLGAAGEVRDRLAVLAGQVEGGFVAVLADAAAALSTRDAPALDRAAAVFAERGYLLLAAEVSAAAGHAHRHAGRRSSARHSFERSAALAGECQGACTPLLDLDGVGTVLTRREREVAVLATTLPSREIAARLGLSVRTVNNYLGRVYQKLGIASRAELQDVLEPRSS